MSTPPFPPPPPPPYIFSVHCKCGRVTANVTASQVSPMRFVCYCRSCRDYFHALNYMAEEEKRTHAAVIDKWGGVDWTLVHTHDIHITRGRKLLHATRFQPNLNIHHVFSTCCFTPMFRFGGHSFFRIHFGSSLALLNTDLIHPEAKPAVSYRIIGRQALKPLGQDKGRPVISWSIPIDLLWKLASRTHPELMPSIPLEFQEEDIYVLEHVKGRENERQLGCSTNCCYAARENQEPQRAALRYY